MNLSTFDNVSHLVPIMESPTPKGLIQMGTITTQSVTIYFAIMLVIVLLTSKFDAAKAKQKGQSK